MCMPKILLKYLRKVPLVDRLFYFQPSSSRCSHTWGCCMCLESSELGPSPLHCPCHHARARLHCCQESIVVTSLLCRSCLFVVKAAASQHFVASAESFEPGDGVGDIWSNSAGCSTPSKAVIATHILPELLLASHRPPSHSNLWRLASLEAVRAAELSNDSRRTSTGMVGWCAHSLHAAIHATLWFRCCMAFSGMSRTVAMSWAHKLNRHTLNMGLCLQ